MTCKKSFLFIVARNAGSVLITLLVVSSGCSKSPATPAQSQPKFSVVLGPEQNVIPPGSPGLLFSPDEHLSYLPNASGSFNMWFAADGGTVGFSTPDMLNLSPLKSANGVPIPLLAPSGAGGAAFDADYAGSGSVFRAANGSDLLMIYHAENHLFGTNHSNGIPFYAGIGLARSGDGGITWQREGQILSGYDPQEASQPPTGAGIGTPAAIEANGYIYIFFREIDLQSKMEGIGIARSLISDDAVPGSWQKFWNGSFASPGLGGAFTPLQLILDKNVPSDHRQPFVTFNAYLNVYVLIVVGNGGIYMSTSPDLVTWTAGQVMLPAPVPDATVTPSTAPYNWYPTLLSPDRPSETVTGKTGYLYYAKGANDGTSHHAMYRRSFTLSLAQ
ncbi:hypothetical protein SAMN05216490_1891 [Mucilaginibacter mallensis]|uniref:Glycosyl hydrolases family 43 n=1 Tax=Mucilaginibacter mallensis TaxID=652787 RepID=A0A1H1VCZ4_MUCMA|nr:hypothetical protein [Mucilaginibacter mallensis]SDS82553.1 hypothetical protein SAMN05216490_1891 [Mucilaginibacter mallensis]